MKILLACSAGMSTSLLVNNMKKFADASDVIEARPVRTVPDILDLPKRNYPDLHIRHR